MVVVLVVAAGLLLRREDDVWANPWAYASPPLLGRWTGDASTAAGTHIGLDLTLTRSPQPLWRRAENADDRDVDGTALLCDSTGRRQLYEFQGSIRDVDGRHALLDLDMPAKEHAGIRFSTLNLEWDGREDLSAWGWLQRITPTGSTLISTQDPDLSRPVKMALHRAPTDQSPCP